MKKSHIILAVVPVVCALGGFGGGMLLKGDEADQATRHSVQPASAAEGVLHTLADKEGGSTTPASHTVPADDDQHSFLQTAMARIIPASFTQGQDADAQPAPAPRIAAPVEVHRINPAKLADHAHKIAKERILAERLAALDAKMAKIEAQATDDSKHPSLLPVDVEAQIHEDAIKRIAASEDHLVKLGRITLPVEGAAKTTYYVADFGVSVTNLDQASYFYDGQNAARLRDQVITTLHELAPTQLLRSDRVDSEELAQRVSKDLRDKFAGVEDFLFLSLYKTDIPRS
ncbi:hypothetical protein [Pseudooceanicola sp.]|uniref:hypothetical protein n=1 Tax=Pseudooceanicola sp. TaxID=1914328 RepID=UPI0035C77386